MTTGQKLISGYFLAAYAFPMIGSALFGDRVAALSGYVILPLTAYGVFVLVAVLALFQLLGLTSLRVLPTLRLPRVRRLLARLGDLYVKFRLGVAAVAIFLGILIVNQGLNSYRYSDIGIAEVQSAPLFFAIILNVILVVDTFFTIFMRPLERRTLLGRVADVAVAAALIVTANGTGSMFLALTAAAAALVPRPFRLLTTGSWGGGLFTATVRGLVAAVAVVALIAAAWFSGESIKGSSAGTSSTLEATTSVIERVQNDDQFFENYVYYFTERMSIYYYSFLYSIATPREVLTQGLPSVVTVPLQTFLYRADYLLGAPFEVQRPAVGSITQLNYQQLTLTPTSDREGSSPGLVASFNYVAVFPFNILLCAFYLRVLARVYDSLLGPRARLSLFGLAVLIVFTQGLFQSPFDWLIVLDDGVIHVILLCGLYLVHGPAEDKNRPRSHSLPQPRRLRGEPYRPTRQAVAHGAVMSQPR